MGPKKLVGPCLACNCNEKQLQFRSITEKAMEKAINSEVYHTRCPELSLGSILCNKCYCAILYPKKQNNENRVSVRELSIDRSYYARPRRKSISVPLENYQDLVSKADNAANLQAQVNELTIELKATRQKPHLTGMLYTYTNNFKLLF